jgi:hypothetical protein
MTKRTQNDALLKASRSAKRAAGITSDTGEITPLEYLLRRMNDETVSSMERDAIAVKIAPYFHPKLKRPRPGELPYDDPFILDDETDNLGAESDAHERIRKRLFERFE